MEVKSQQITNLSNRLPKLELSYETVVHKKVSPIYDICVSIPTGKRQFVWFTYDEDGDVCYLMDLTRDGKIGHIEHLHVDFIKSDTLDTSYSHSISYGTILYGTLCTIDGLSFFIADDIYYYKGIYTKPLTFDEKFGFLSDVISHLSLDQFSFDPHMKGAEMNGLEPLLCTSSIKDVSRIIIKMACIETVSSENQSVRLEPAYVSHHLQYRSSSQVMPYLNQTVKPRSFVTTPAVEPKIYIPRNDLDFSAPTYKTEVVFRVMADIQSDIYLLYAFNNDVFEFVDIAYIGSRKESAFMNTLFRNIRENLNVDYGEESEDEDMFQNTSVDKYVDLKTEYKMICSFHHKFKKWVPVRTVDAKTRCVNMNQLTRRQGTNMKPLVSDAKRPSGSDAKRPYQSYEKPYGSDASRPSGSGYTKPYGSDASRPYQSDTKSYQSNTSRPSGSGYTKPYGSDASRPYPKAPNLTIPVETQSQHFLSKPLEKKPFQHNRERKLC